MKCTTFLYTQVGGGVHSRGCRNEKKKLGVSNTPYDGGWCVTDGGWCVTDGGWCITDGGWWVTDGGWWVATKHQRVDAIVKKKKGERPYGTPWSTVESQPKGAARLSVDLRPCARRFGGGSRGGGGGMVLMALVLPAACHPRKAFHTPEAQARAPV